VGKAEAEHDGADAIVETRGDAEREDGQCGEMPVHAVARPGCDPLETVVFKVEAGQDPDLLDGAAQKMPDQVDAHDDPKEDPEDDQEGIIDGCVEGL